MKNLSAVSFLQITIVGTTASSVLCLTLIDASIKSFILLIAATIVCLALFRTSAATRHLAWAGKRTRLLG